MKKIIFILMLIVSFSSQARYDCAGQISEVMHWASQCNGNLAFRISSQNNKWICTNNEKDEVIVLTAYANGKPVITRMHYPESSCSDSSITHYRQLGYIIAR